MGIEFELKYSATAQAQAALRQAIQGEWLSLQMETTYYDTREGYLAQRHYTLRRRLENGKSVCTIKTPSGSTARGEWETECEDIIAAIPELCKLGCPKDLAVFADMGLIPVCGARFTRQACTLNSGDAVLELALDKGVLFGGSKEIPLCEAEVELKSGSEEAALAFGKELAAVYGLQPEPKSKFRRALDLREGE